MLIDNPTEKIIAMRTCAVNLNFLLLKETEQLSSEVTKIIPKSLKLI